MKKTIIICLFVLFSAELLAQIDNNSVEETDIFEYQPQDNDHQEFSPQENQGTAMSAEIMTLFGTLSEIADKFPNYSVKPENRKRSMTDLNDRQKDVMVRKFWNGQDVTVKKFKTSLELGRYETDSRTIRIICRDHSYVDGDRVKLYVNEQVIRRSITLEGGYFTINIDLKDGFNRIDIEALNQGSSGPNTAEFKVYDENGQLLASREWNILTGYIATMVVMKK